MVFIWKSKILWEVLSKEIFHLTLFQKYFILLGHLMRWLKLNRHSLRFSVVEYFSLQFFQWVMKCTVNGACFGMLLISPLILAQHRTAWMSWCRSYQGCTQYVDTSILSMLSFQYNNGLICCLSIIWQTFDPQFVRLFPNVYEDNGEWPLALTLYKSASGHLTIQQA